MYRFSNDITTSHDDVTGQIRLRFATVARNASIDLIRHTDVAADALNNTISAQIVHSRTIDLDTYYIIHSRIYTRVFFSLSFDFPDDYYISNGIKQNGRNIKNKSNTKRT